MFFRYAVMKPRCARKILPVLSISRNLFHALRLTFNTFTIFLMVFQKIRLLTSLIFAHLGTMPCNCFRNCHYKSPPFLPKNIEAIVPIKLLSSEGFDLSLSAFRIKLAPDVSGTDPKSFRVKAPVPVLPGTP